MEKEAYIIVYEENRYNDLYDILFSDLLRRPHTYKVIEKTFPVSGLYKYFISRKVNRCTFGLAEKAYWKYYRLPKKVKELKKKYKKVKVIFHNASLRRTNYPETILRMLKKRGTELILLYLDACSDEVVCGNANTLRRKNIFDKVYTIDSADARAYGLSLCMTPYSTPAIGKEQIQISSDLYFCGQNKGRIYKLFQIWNEARIIGAQVKYDLVFCRDFKDFFQTDKGINFSDEYIDYTTLLKRSLSANCILDLVQVGQSALTLRPYEAVVFNKKLLTNNKSIFQFKYYNEKYMRYFENVEDIDWNWVKESIEIDYHYEGDFSPLRLFIQ